MATPKYNKPQTLTDYIALRAAGTPKIKAAKVLGTTTNTLRKLERNTADIQDLIKEAGELLVREGLPAAINLSLDTIKLSQDQPPDQIDTDDPKSSHNKIKLRKLAIDTSEAVLKASGILPTQTAAPVIHNLTIKNQAILLPGVRNVLNSLASQTIDVTPIEAETDND